MSAECYLVRVNDNVVQNDIYLGGNGTRDDIRALAKEQELKPAVNENGFTVLPITREQFVQFMKNGPSLYGDAQFTTEACRLEYKQDGQLQFVIKS
jgi:hypothetical protein